jgi:hypothetical protein
MNNATTDRDLLILEPLLYVDPFLTVQKLCGGSDGQLTGTTFSSAACNFQASGVREGMVLCLRVAGPAVAYEVLSIASAHELSVSLLREKADAQPLSPPPATNAIFYVHTYRPQIQSVADRLLEGLRRNGQSVPDPSTLEDSPRFRQAVALGALADIFASRLVNTASDDVNASKAQLYRGLFESAAESFQLSASDQSEASLGNVQLRRS